MISTKLASISTMSSKLMVANLCTTQRLDKKTLELPKRPANIYAIHLKEKFHEIKANNPDMRLPELSKKIKEAYESMPAVKKEELIARGKEDRDRYFAQKEALMSTFEGRVAWRQFQVEKKLKENQSDLKKLRKDMPKRPAPPYLLFAQESYDKTISIPENANIMAQKWAKLAEEEKQKYRDQFEAEKKVYFESLAKWKEEVKDNPALKQKEVLKKELKVQESMKKLPILAKEMKQILKALDL